MQQMPDTTANLFDEPQLSLSLVNGDRERFNVPAAAGFRVMELIRAHGYPIKAECGGACVCSTCHVRVPASWRDLLPPPSDEEMSKLDEIPSSGDDSRLACQLIMTDDLHGLEVEVQPDSLKRPLSSVAG
jgi:ferredoxin, 2Fe-2S